MNKNNAPRLKEFVSRESYSILLIVIFAVVLILFPAIKGQNIWTGATIKSMAMQFPEYGVMALGVMLSFISGGMDLSFVSVANLTAIIAVTIMNSEAGQANVGPMIAVAVFAAIAMGAVLGYLNGTLITGLGIPPMLATLATKQVYSGVAKALTQGKSQSLLDGTYAEIGHKTVFGFITVPLLIFIICFIAIAFLLTKTVYGENLYMMGSNQKAAKFSAMNTNRMTRVTYMVSGMLASVGGLIMISTYNSAKADYGSSYLMQCILICVLAGISTSGGKGKIGNVLLSIVIVQVISSGVNNFPDLNVYYRSLIWGLLLLVMMITDYLRGGETSKIIKKFFSKRKPSPAQPQ